MDDPIVKPDALFDRDVEWSDLASFATNPAPGATLAILYGRRRQGKTLMLELLAEAREGFLFTGLEQSSAQNLAAMSEAYRAFTGTVAPIAFAGWDQVVDALLALGERERPLPVIVDELPYLLRTAPEIPSIIQRALSPRGRARQRSRARLVLCGSALTVMSRLLGGAAALRGRASREMMVHPFGFRESARFWEIATDLELAFRLHALLGGTPAYRDFCEGDQPRSAAELDRWVARKLLNPSTAFFREGRVLLAEEPELGELSLYFSVLSAIADGRTRRGQIADAVGRKESALSHALSVLEETRLIVRSRDALRENRATYRIAEPMLRFHQLVIAPNESRLTRRDGERIWAQLADTVSSRIYGPHFEDLAREWSMQHASLDTLGGTASQVGRTEINCSEHRHQHELDVVAIERPPNSGERVLAIGEAKWRSEPVGLRELQRLRHIRGVMNQPAARLLLFSREGFDPDLATEAYRARDIELVDMDRLYSGE
jgi:AAA+ ATPase superfamily predicted ATPase